MLLPPFCGFSLPQLLLLVLFPQFGSSFSLSLSSVVFFGFISLKLTRADIGGVLRHTRAPCKSLGTETLNNRFWCYFVCISRGASCWIRLHLFHLFCWRCFWSRLERCSPVNLTAAWSSLCFISPAALMRGVEFGYRGRRVGFDHWLSGAGHCTEAVAVVGPSLAMLLISPRDRLHLWAWPRGQRRSHMAIRQSAGVASRRWRQLGGLP